MLQCSYLSEGCDGGWAIFNGYFAEQAYVVADKCFPYHAKTKGFKCGESAKCPAIAKVRNAQVIGGAYGMNTEENMMQELLMNGPINAEANVPGGTWSVYSTGILGEDREAKLENKMKSAAGKKEQIVDSLL